MDKKNNLGCIPPYHDEQQNKENRASPVTHAFHVYQKETKESETH